MKSFNIGTTFKTLSEDEFLVVYNNLCLIPGIILSQEIQEEYKRIRDIKAAKLPPVTGPMARKGKKE